MSKYLPDISEQCSESEINSKNRWKQPSFGRIQQPDIKALCTPDIRSCHPLTDTICCLLVVIGKIFTSRFHVLNVKIRSVSSERRRKHIQSVCDEYSTVMWAAYPLPWRDEIPVRPPERACLTIPRTVWARNYAMEGFTLVVIKITSI